MLLGCECRSLWDLVKEMAVVRVTSDAYVFMVGWSCFNLFFNFFLYSIVALWKKLIFFSQILSVRLGLFTFEHNEPILLCMTFMSYMHCDSTDFMHKYLMNDAICTQKRFFHLS